VAKSTASWDWKESGGENIARAIKLLGIHSYEIDTGGDNYGMVFSTEPMTQKEADKFFEEDTCG